MYKERLKNKNTYFVVLADITVLVISYLLAYLLRFDFQLPLEYWSIIGSTILFLVPSKIIIFYAFGLYRGIYRYTSLWDVLNILKATSTASLLIIVFYSLSLEFEGLHRSILVMDYLISTIFVGLVRVSVRFYYTSVQSAPFLTTTKKKTRLILLGAGNTGEKIVREREK